jgi:hypothetical protein
MNEYAVKMTDLRYGSNEIVYVRANHETNAIILAQEQYDDGWLTGEVNLISGND